MVRDNHFPSKLLLNDLIKRRGRKGFVVLDCIEKKSSTEENCQMSKSDKNTPKIEKHETVFSNVIRGCKVECYGIVSCTLFVEKKP